MRRSCPDFSRETGVYRKETWDAISHVFETPREGEPKWDEEFERLTGSGKAAEMHNCGSPDFSSGRRSAKSRGIRLLDVPPNATVEERVEIKTEDYAGGVSRLISSLVCGPFLYLGPYRIGRRVHDRPPHVGAQIELQL